MIRKAACGARLMTDDRSNYEHEWKKEAIRGLRGQNGLDSFELSLFEWYAGKNEHVIEQMLLKERDFIKQQTGAGRNCIDDSAILAVEYYIKRGRYASVIYMTSLLETYLSQACGSLTSILGEENIHFKPDELAGDKWTKRKTFLERYGGFAFPENAWPDLKMLIRIRNILVHDNGSPDCISDADKSHISKCAGITITQHELVIEKEYIDDCLSAFRLLVDCISSKLDRRIDCTLHSQSISQP